MSSLLSLAPLYLLGNLHCVGMCGPLVALLAKHPYRHAYFLGRALAFTLAGAFAGEAGTLIAQLLHPLFIPSLFTFALALFFLMVALFFLFDFSLPPSSFSRFLTRLSVSASKLLLKESFLPVFLFGSATLLLPCGQSLLVLSFSSMTKSAPLGALNALLFALLTTPALWIVLRGALFLRKIQRHYRPLMAVAFLVMSSLSLLRGLADLDLVKHFSLAEHIVLY